MSLYYENSCSSCNTNFNNPTLNISKDCGVPAIRNILVKIINFIQGYRDENFNVSLEITTKNGLSKVVEINKNNTPLSLNESNLVVANSVFSLCDIVKINILTGDIINSEFYQYMITYLKRVGKYNNNSCTGFIKCKEDFSSDLKCSKEMQNYIGQNINRIKSINYNGGLLKAQVIPENQNSIIINVVDSANLTSTNSTIIAESNLDVTTSPVISGISLNEERSQALSNANLNTSTKSVIKTFEPTNTNIVSDITLSNSPLISDLNVNRTNVSAPVTTNQETVVSGVSLSTEQPVSEILEANINAVEALNESTQNVLSGITTTNENVIESINTTTSTGFTNLNENQATAYGGVNTTTQTVVESITVTPKTVVKSLSLTPRMAVTGVTTGNVNGTISGLTSASSEATTSAQVPTFSIPAGTTNQPLQITIPANAFGSGQPANDQTLDVQVNGTNVTFSNYSTAYFLPNQTNVISAQGTPAVSNVEHITNTTKLQVIEDVDINNEQVVGNITSTNTANPVLKTIVLDNDTQVIKSINPTDVNVIKNITPNNLSVIETVTEDAPVSAITAVNPTTTPVVSDITLNRSNRRGYENDTTETINSISTPTTTSVVENLTSNLSNFKGVENVTTSNVTNLFNTTEKNVVSSANLNSTTENIISSANVTTNNENAISTAIFNNSYDTILSSINLDTTTKKALKSLSSEARQVIIPTEENLNGEIIAVGDGILLVNNNNDNLTLYSICDAQSATI